MIFLSNLVMKERRYVKWGGIVGKYSSGGNWRKKAWKRPNGDFYNNWSLRHWVLRVECKINSELTARLAHHWKISGNWRFNSKCQGHDRESHCPTPLWGCPSNHGTKDHGDGQEVAVWEKGEVVMLEGQSPPKEKQDWFITLSGTAKVILVVMI